MALTAEQHAKRDGFITGSFLPALMAGDKPKILSEWKRIIGDPGYEPENLDDVWPVQFGSYIETFAIDWHQRKTDKQLTRRGEWVIHPDRPYFGCTLDCYRADDATVIDCKAPGMWRKIEDVIAQYTPQIIGQAGCIPGSKGALLIVLGGSEPSEYEVTWDAAYELEMWNRVEQFWHFVETLTPPVELEPVVAPVPAVKTYDMSSSNEWAALAGMWIENKIAAGSFNAAVKELKAITPADAVKAFGHGVVVSRSKSGALSIKGEKK